MRLDLEVAGGEKRVLLEACKKGFASHAEAEAAVGSDDAGEVVRELGATCHVPDAFPATLYLLLRFGHSLEDALVKNAMAGGDSAARGMLLGTILGARDGVAAIPETWLGAMEATGEIRQLLGVPARPPAGHSRFEFGNAEGLTLAGALEAPDGEIQGTALFALNRRNEPGSVFLQENRGLTFSVSYSLQFAQSRGNFP